MPNKVLWDYEVMDRVGTSGFGLTFRAEHWHLRERLCAVKLVQAPYIEPFKAAGEMLLKLAQMADKAVAANAAAARYLTRVLSLRYDIDEPYIIMEWIDGGSLADRVKKGPLPLDQLLQIIAGALEGLAYYHNQGLIHGNLKPTNILLTREGVPKLSDFGGYFRGEGLVPSLAAVRYLSPEQLDAEADASKPPDPRSDLYSMTLLLYEMCTGRQAPRVLTGPQLPSRVSSRVPKAFDDLIGQGLDPEPKSRFRDARAMYNAIMQAAGVAGPAPFGAAPTPQAEPEAAAEPPAAEEAAAAEPAAVLPKLGDTKINEIDGAEMVWVPAGTLRMGSEDHEDERPVCDVEIQGFWIYKCPVAQDQFWKSLMETGEKGKLPRLPQKFIKGAQYDKVPAAGISWQEAAAYCRWAGVRLPTEAEWEWAARGPEGRIYPWGDSWDQARANTMESGQMKQTEPQSLGNSWCGAQGMSGNVFEWCSTLFRPYPYDPADGREDPPENTDDRVLRGGSATTDADMARTTYRCAPNYLARLTGFRPIRSA